MNKDFKTCKSSYNPEDMRRLILDSKSKIKDSKNRDSRDTFVPFVNDWSVK